ncbi:Arfaptin-like domain protein, partial [Teladorsagia circumcincta]
PENEANMDGTDVMSRFPNLPKMAEAVGNVDVVAKVESLKKWTIGTFKNSRQQLLEHMGKPQCSTTSESMRRVAEQATALDGCLRYFLSSMETLHAKTIVDTLETIYATEGARIEFDVSRHELESLHSQATASPTAIQIASDKASQHRDKYEGLKADVR